MFLKHILNHLRSQKLSPLLPERHHSAALKTAANCVAVVVTEDHVQETRKLLLGDGWEDASGPLALVLPVAEVHPPLPLHGPEDRHIQRLQEVGRVLRQKDKPDVPVLAELDDSWGHMGGQVVPDYYLHLLLRELLDVVDEHDPKPLLEGFHINPARDGGGVAGAHRTILTPGVVQHPISRLEDDHGLQHGPVCSDAEHHREGDLAGPPDLLEVLRTAGSEGQLGTCCKI